MGAICLKRGELWIIRIPAEKKIGKIKSRLDKILDEVTAEAGKTTCLQAVNGADEFIAAAEDGCLENTRLIFAVEIPASGINLEAYRILDFLQKTFAASGKCDDCADSAAAPKGPASSSPAMLKGSVGGVIVDGSSSLYTKDIGRRFLFAANMTGCSFPGKPLVEATSDLANFKVVARLWSVDLYGAYVKSCISLAEKIISFSFENQREPNIVAIHASSHKTSNSLALWRMISSELDGAAEVEEISIRNGQVWDCQGCKYEDCLHFGEKGDCFYGGVMVEKVYPAIVKCDILVLICPNYNDSVSANIMAFINRLTSVFRVNDFSKKRVYAVIVSGYSGGDIVAQQVIGAINVNKNFMLPAGFALMETANDPGDAEKIHGIEQRCRRFAEKMLGK